MEAVTGGGAAPFEGEGLTLGACIVTVRAAGGGVGSPLTCPFSSYQRRSLYASLMKAFKSSGWQPFVGRFAPSGKRANIFAMLIALPPPFSCLSNSTSAMVQLLMVTLCEERRWGLGACRGCEVLGGR